MRYSKTTVKKRKYDPDVDVNSHRPFIIDYEMRKSDCGFMNMYNTSSSAGQNKRGQQTFGIVQLDFEDFYTLMRLKIQY